MNRTDRRGGRGMNRVEQRRADVLRVVDRYGTFAAIPGWLLTKKAFWVSAFDDVELTVTLEPDAHVSFRSVLDLGGITLERPFLLRLISVNVTAARRGMGSVGSTKTPVPSSGSTAPMFQRTTPRTSMPA